MAPMLPMLAALIVAAGGEGPGDYEAAKARAGDGPDGLVRLALWCERHGMGPERVRNLTLALERRPDDPKARALLGMVRVDGQWREAGEASARTAPAGLAGYEARRAAIDPGRAEDQWQLALWCLRHGLHDVARAHLTAVTRLEPSREAAWRHLGYQRHKGRWMTPAAIRAEIDGARLRQEADIRWGPEFDRLLTRLHRPGPRDEEAERALDAVRDPRAVGKLWEVFVLRSRHAEDWARAARVLGRIEGPEATLRLARLAASSPDAGAAAAASEEILRRDPREAITDLVDMLREPLAFLVVPGSNGAVVGELQVEGKAYNLDRFYVLREQYNPLFELNAIPATRRVIGGGTGIGVVQTDIPPRAVADYASARLDAQAAIRRDAALLERFNASIVAANGRIDALLRALTGRVVVHDPSGGDTARRPEEAPAGRGRGARPARKQAAKKDQGNPARLGEEMMARLDVLARQRREAELTSRMAADPQVRMAAAARARMLAEQAIEVQVEYWDAALRAREEATDRARDAAWDVRKRPVDRETARNDAWRHWWSDERGYTRDEPTATGPRPTVVQVRTTDVPVVIVPGMTSTGIAVRTIPVHTSCFAAGTLVHTRTGRRPIEGVQVGDLVLSQDTATGALDYRAVVAVHHRRPAPTYRIKLVGEDLVATGIHRFWKAGAGWTMARDLKPGDAIRTVGGLLAVDSVAPDEVQPVYNLDVDRTRSFFVGTAGSLVHDDRIPEPVAVPFDAVAELAP